MDWSIGSTLFRVLYPRNANQILCASLIGIEPLTQTIERKTYLHVNIEMGLPSGPHGVKTYCKEHFPNSLREFASLAECREATKHTTAQTLVILDGNVLVRNVPVAVDRYESYSAVFRGFINAALNTGDNVFVVFDEPKRVTKAKVEEQRKRDAASKKAAPIVSPDIQDQLAPITDDYDTESLQSFNPHEIMKHRKARDRFFDGLCKDIMLHFMREWASSKSPNRKSLTFDGIDPRGADRPPSEARAPVMYSSNDLIETKLSRKPNEYHPGEGDIKLSDLQNRVAHLRGDGQIFERIDLILVSTIDTDSLGIELLGRASRELEPLPRPTKTVLCFREPQRKRKTTEEPRSEGTSFACFDIDMLYEVVVAKLFHHCEERPAPDVCSGALSLICAGWCLCGCDFVRLAGMRSDVVFSVVSDLCNSESGIRLLKSMLYVTSEETTMARKRLSHAISKLIDGCVTQLSDMPRLKRASASAAEYEPSHVRRAAWCVLYWNGIEITDLDEWGF